MKALPLPWFDGLARILALVEEEGVWPDGLLDAFFAMIPKSDGDATPPGPASSVCFARDFSVLGFSSDVAVRSLGSGLGYLLRCLALGVVAARSMPGSPRR